MDPDCFTRQSCVRKHRPMKTKYLISVVLLAILFLTQPANAGQIDRLRYSSSPEYNRIVLDANEPVSLQGIQTDQKDTLTLRLGKCKLNPEMPEFTINSSMVAAVEFETSGTDTTRMHVRLKVPASARVFTMANPDRVVMDLYPDVPQGKPSVIPDPNKAVPLKVTADPIAELIQTYGNSDASEAEQSTDTSEAAKLTEAPEPTTTVPEAGTEGGSTENGDTKTAQIGTVASPSPVQLDVDTGEQSQPAMPLHTPPQDDTWTLSNPWILGQLLLDAFLMGLLVVLFRHAQKLNATVTMQRAKIKAFAQTPVQTAAQQSEQNTGSVQHTHALRPSSQNQQPQASVADFESLIRQVEQMGAEIRTVSSHERVLEQSQKKRRRTTAQTGSQETRPVSKPRTETTSPPIRPQKPRPVAGTERQMTETASKDLSFDEMKAALSKLSAEIETLMESDSSEAAQLSKRRSQRGRVSEQRLSQPVQEQTVQDKVVALAAQGREPIDISRELGVNLGEVELILSLRAN